MSVPFLTKSIKTKLKVQCQGVYATQIVHLTGIKRNNFIVFITKKTNTVFRYQLHNILYS